MDTLVQAHYQLLSTFEFSEDAESLSALSEAEKKAFIRIVNFIATKKGQDLKTAIKDLSEGLWPTRRIDNDASVEYEAPRLKQELVESKKNLEQLELFSARYIEALQDRAYTAEVKAEQVRLKRQAQLEEDKKNGLLPFPKTAY